VLRRTVAVVALALAALGLPAAARPDAAHRCLVVTNLGEASFARNFNPFDLSLDFTSGGIYEPLVVVTSAGGGHRYNWLASAFAWSRDRKTLTLTVRHGVRWTDGVPLTNRDVVYTLTAGRQDRVMDQIGLTRRGNEVVSVRTSAETGSRSGSAGSTRRSSRTCWRTTCVSSPSTCSRTCTTSPAG
jgi:peptide/nickel transport system substrate-binding protein